MELRTGRPVKSSRTHSYSKCLPCTNNKLVGGATIVATVGIVLALGEFYILEGWMFKKIDT